MNYSNNHNISLALAVGLAHNTYDYHPNTISVTTLMKSTRQVILSQRLDNELAVTDVSDLLASSLGTAFHDRMEQAWLSPDLPKVLKQLGYPKRIHENIKVNPTEQDFADNPKLVPVYIENRTFKEFMGKTISGKYDIVINGKVEDYKTTSVWRYILGSSDQDYITQLSMYRWLNPDVITSDVATIHFVFTDWSAGQAKANNDYPSLRALSKDFKLMSLKDTEQYARNRLQQLSHHQNTPEAQLPLCTTEELWRKQPVYKYYKNPAKTTRSTANFDTHTEAMQRLVQDGSVGTVLKVEGEVVACKYCSAFPICTQKDQYLATGELKL